MKVNEYKLNHNVEIGGTYRFSEVFMFKLCEEYIVALFTYYNVHVYCKQQELAASLQKLN